MFRQAVRGLHMTRQVLVHPKHRSVEPVVRETVKNITFSDIVKANVLLWGVGGACFAPYYTEKNMDKRYTTPAELLTFKVATVPFGAFLGTALSFLPPLWPETYRMVRDTIKKTTEN